MSADIFQHALDHASTSLDCFFNPKSVAVVGATERAGAIGRTMIRNVKNDSKGCRIIYPINPKAKTVLGLPAYPSIEACPTVPDLVIIVTPASTVPPMVQTCVDRRVPAVIIITAGFKEVGGEGAKMEAEMQRMIHQPGSITRIVGPNCFGVMCPHYNLNATFGTQMVGDGNIGLISQSGAMLCSILDWAIFNGVGFANFVSVGSMMDVDWCALLEYMGNAPNIRAILIYMETVGDARGFLSAASQVSHRKPIIVLKAGRTQAAAAAAVSHTGSLTGSDDMLDAAFRRAGVVRVDTISELFWLAQALTTQPLPKGPRLCIVTNAGGPGVMATDAVIRAGGALSVLSKETKEKYSTFLPPHWSHANPVDMIGSATADDYLRALDIAMEDEDCDAVLSIQVPVAQLNAPLAAQAIKAAGTDNKKPMLACVMGGEEVQGARAMLARASVPVFGFSDDACRVFGYMWQYVRQLRDLYEVPKPCGVPAHEAQHVAAEADAIINRVYGAHRNILTESESKKLMATYGIPVADTVVCPTAPEAAAQAKKMGFPVVVKLNSETITHKSDVGGVMLNINSEAEVLAAYERIRQNVTAKKGAEHFQGVTVQPMIDPNSYELLLGATSDVQLGPIIVFGSGGKLVEVMKDTALAVPPLNSHLASNLIHATKISKALKGFRGQPAVNEERLADLLCRFSSMLMNHRYIREVDINPIMACGDRIIAVDARIVLYPEGTTMDKIPVAGICGYPIDQVSSVGAATLRPVCASDIPAMTAFLNALDEHAIVGVKKALPAAARVDPERLVKICFADYARNHTIVAEAGAEIVGVARMLRVIPSDGVAVACVGVRAGKQELREPLLAKLKEVAAKEGLKRICMEADPADAATLHFLEAHGFARVASSVADIAAFECPIAHAN